MRNQKCTKGLQRAAMLAVVAIMFAFITGCGEDDCSDSEKMVTYQGSEECRATCSNTDDCGDNQFCHDSENVCLPESNGGGETCDPECEDGFSCDGGECVEDAVSGCDPACDSGFVCENDQCVEESTNNSNVCDPECGDNQTCESGQCVDQAPDNSSSHGGLTNQELCDVYCDLIYGCLGECGLDGSGGVGFCRTGDPQDPTANGCYGDVETDRSGIEDFVYGDFQDGDAPLSDEPNTCEDTKWLRCGQFGTWEQCGDCTPPSTVGDACMDDSVCDSGDLIFSECFDPTRTAAEDPIVDGQCLIGTCYIPAGVDAGDVNIDGGCGADNGCQAAPIFEGGQLGGVCEQLCDSSDECGENRACQISGSLYERTGLDQGEPSPIGVARTCTFQCDDDDDCGEGRCNADGACELPCGDEGELDALCDAVDGACEMGDDSEMYCALDGE